MADQGLIAQLKPTAATDTVLYSAPIDASVSAVLTIANDGTGSAYDVGIKDYDQKLVVGTGHRLHEGDVVTGYRFQLDTPVLSTAGLSEGTTLTSSDNEKTAKFESFYIPDTTVIEVKDVSIRQITVESVSGNFAVGETLSTGTAPDDTTALIYAVAQGSGSTILYIGPSTINGGGAEFAEGDSLSSTGGATATISVGGIGTAVNEFAFSEDSGSTFDLFIGTQLIGFSDRTYRFDVSDSSMTGRDFKLSETVNGEWGPDGVFGGASTDDGTEYTLGKTTNGTAGSPSAYVQYDLTQATFTSGSLYFYDGGTGTASNADYGGSDRVFTISDGYSYDEIFVYDIDGTWTDNVDTFIYNGVTYTITGQISGPYGYVRSYAGTALSVIKGIGSADFAPADSFKDVPLLPGSVRETVTVASVTVAVDTIEPANYLIEGATNAANNAAKITSIVVGPGERLLVNSATANNTFSLVGFEDASTAFVTRTYVAQAQAAAAS